MPQVPGPPVLGKFVAQFTHRMAVLLWVGAGIAIFAGLPQLVTEALQNLLPRWARVRRGGVEIRIPAEEFVCGDILLLGEGEQISADARLIWGVDFRVGPGAQGAPRPNSAGPGASPGRRPLPRG